MLASFDTSAMGIAARSRRCAASSIIRSRLVGPTRRARRACRSPAGLALPYRGWRAKFGGQPVPLLTQPGTVGFQAGDPGSTVLPDLLNPRCRLLADLPGHPAGILTGLRKLGPHAVRLPFGLRAQFLPFPGSIGQRVGDRLPGIGADPVQFGADFGLRGARPVRLAAGLLRLGGSMFNGFVSLADGQGDLLVGCPPDRFQLGQVPGAKARRHRAVGDHPAPEPAQRTRDIQH